MRNDREIRVAPSIPGRRVTLRMQARRRLRHGAARRGKTTPEYQAWEAAKRRCANPRHAQFQDYGGRGIMMCERWRLDFAAFLADMGSRPTGMSLDRIDNDGHYEPGNCRWATLSQQGVNRRWHRHWSRRSRVNDGLAARWLDAFLAAA